MKTVKAFITSGYRGFPVIVNTNDYKLSSARVKENFSPPPEKLFFEAKTSSFLIKY
jgi:hypothetical protein